MTKLIAGALLVLLALVSVPTPAHALGSAQEVADNCRDLLRPDPPQSFDVGLCVGSFTTLYALSGVVDQHKAPILGFCRPPNTQYLDMVRVFVRHVESHPQAGQAFYAIEAVNAFVNAYPCKRKS
ncbi:MAG: hypothetical protein HY060_18540 [Proteobacteria bacterium]|nr:hypothetical protein [Pseudomonadota bacterium]